VGFKFMEMGTVATGLGYDGKENYNSFVNVKVLPFETATNCK